MLCRVCSLEGIDSEKRNGVKKGTSKERLYRVYQNRIAVVKLCYLHSIEFFLIGEQRFLQNHLILAGDIYHNQNEYLSEEI